MQDKLCMDSRHWTDEGMQFWVGNSKVKGKFLEQADI